MKNYDNAFYDLGGPLQSMIVRLADTCVATTPDPTAAALCPSSYGPIITDDHRTYLWNIYVDFFSAQPAYVVLDYYRCHILNGLPTSGTVADAIGRHLNIKKADELSGLSQSIAKNLGEDY